MSRAFLQRRLEDAEARLAIRRVRLSERQADLIVVAVVGILNGLDLTDEQWAEAPEVAARELRRAGAKDHPPGGW